MNVIHNIDASKYDNKTPIDAKLQSFGKYLAEESRLRSFLKGRLIPLSQVGQCSMRARALRWRFAASARGTGWLGRYRLAPSPDELLGYRRARQSPQRRAHSPARAATPKDRDRHPRRRFGFDPPALDFG
jgi:hypothetical protein